MDVWRGVQGRCFFFKSAIELIQIVCLFLSAGGWCLLTGDVFRTFPH